MRKFPCTIMRGGTSKATFFLEEDMPSNREDWESFLLDIMGSPDKRQIDGLGGGNSLTSKAAIIKKSDKEGFDVDYTFGQVSLDKFKVDFKGNCGNISSAVGPYALIKGLVDPVEPRTRVRIYNTNTGKRIDAQVAVKDGKFDPDGNFYIPGVPNPGSLEELTFYSPDGSVTGKLLPTGKASEMIDTSKGPIRISILDAANPLVYVKAEDVGLQGTEQHYDFTDDDLTYLEEIRSIAAELCGFCSKEEATAYSPAVPKMTLLSEPKFYEDSSGKTHKPESMDMLIRMLSMQRPHQALAITGAACTAAAINTQGTIANEIIGGGKLDTIRVGHPSGIMNMAYACSEEEGISVSVERTARCIMEGYVYTRDDYNVDRL